MAKFPPAYFNGEVTDESQTNGTPAYLTASPIPMILTLWEKMSFVERSRLAAYGAIPGASPLKNLPLSKVVPSGTDSTALTAAISAASALATRDNPGVVLLRENTTLATDVSVLPNVALVSDNGATISGSGQVLLQSHSQIRGINFDNTVKFQTANATSGVKIIGCRFNYSGLQIYDSGTATNKPHTYTEVLWNEFVGGNGRYGIYFTYLSKASIKFNWYHANYGEGRGIFGLNLDNSEVEFNHIDGGIVGIGLLFDRSKPRFNSNTKTCRNLVENISEEGISFDVSGNDPAKMSCVDRLVVSSVSGTSSSNPSIICARTTPNETTGIIAGVYAVVLDTALAGLTLKSNYVAASGTGSVRIQFPNNSLSQTQLSSLVGANVSIQYLADNFSIEENYLNNCTSPIVSWGMLCNSQITRNIIKNKPDGLDAIKVASLGGLSPSSAIMGSGSCFSVSTNVLISGNKIIDGNTQGIYYRGVSYGSEINTTSYISSMPEIYGVNSDDVVVENWKSDSWTSTLPVSVLTGVSAPNPNIEAFRHDADTGLQFADSRAKSGVTTFSGDGSNKVFDIKHELDAVPRTLQWSAGSSDAKGEAYATSTDTSLTITYTSPPPAGASNVVIYWQVSV